MTFKPEQVKCSSCFAWICEVDTRTKAPTRVRQNARVDDVREERPAYVRSAGEHLQGPRPLVAFPENVPDIKEVHVDTRPVVGYEGRCAKCKAVTRWKVPAKKIPPPPNIS